MAKNNRVEKVNDANSSNKDLALIITTLMASTFVATTVVFFVLWLKRKNQLSSPTQLITPSGEDDYMIAIINDSTLITDDVVKGYMAAIQTQIVRDFFPAWGVNAVLEFFDKKQTGIVPANYMELHLVDTYDQADALGYHTVTSSGMPLGLVAVEITQQAGEPVSLVMSHEILEMIIDPFAANSVFAQTSSTGGTIVAYEVCDPCQSEQHGYYIGTVLVSDFVLPVWFQFYTPTVAKYDFRGHIKQPFTLLNGGYALVFKVPNNGSGWTAVYGAFLNNTSVLANRSMSYAETKLCGRVKQRLNTDPTLTEHVKSLYLPENASNIHKTLVKTGTRLRHISNL